MISSKLSQPKQWWGATDFCKWRGQYECRKLPLSTSSYRKCWLDLDGALSLEYSIATACRHYGGIKTNINKTCYLFSKSAQSCLRKKHQQVTENVVSDLCSSLLSQNLRFITQHRITINSFLLLATASSSLWPTCACPKSMVKNPASCPSMRSAFEPWFCHSWGLRSSTSVTINLDCQLDCNEKCLGHW